MQSKTQKPGGLLPRHTAIVEAAAARIFPTTTTPGATEAGVLNYIVRLLTEVYPELDSRYRDGCRALNRHAKRRFGLGFLSITHEDQDAVLADFEAGRVPEFKQGAVFFETLRDHTMEGVLGEPAYGGNRDLLGWKLVGFPGHQFGYADPHINKPVKIEPVALDRPYADEEEWHAKSR
ncbi:MAG TPA: gluconate 2-dehydrogenase subunit 3 family protein [Candidatus Binatia bacterium]